MIQPHNLTEGNELRIDSDITNSDVYKVTDVSIKSLGISIVVAVALAGDDGNWLLSGTKGASSYLLTTDGDSTNYSIQLAQIDVIDE